MRVSIIAAQLILGYYVLVKRRKTKVMAALTPLAAADLGPLGGMTNLTILALNGDLIDDISVLSGHVNLELLGLSINQISDISILSGLYQTGLIATARGYCQSLRGSPLFEQLRGTPV
ncbi:MAG: leucine-rich repeat domain-containing protein [Deltaproteobacteria bacterium]|nr:leucine-rich repeat domain-containing protein [Deltaproteobacteria bacterium]